MNHMSIICGPPEVGKTSLSLELALDSWRRGVWQFVVDPNRQFRAICDHYECFAEWRARARAAHAAGAELPRGASFASGDGLAEGIYELGKRLNTVDAARFPMRYVADEASVLKGSGSTWIGKADEQLINNRRHRQVEISLNLQRPSQLVTAFWETATDVYLFAQSKPARVRDLEDALDLPDGALEACLRLPDHRYYHVVPRRGIV